MSQFCGSLLAFTSRCGVTSAAIAGAIAARPIDHMTASVVLRSMSSLQVLIFSEFSAAGAKRVASSLGHGRLVPINLAPCPAPSLPSPACWEGREGQGQAQRRRHERNRET